MSAHTDLPLRNPFDPVPVTPATLLRRVPHKLILQVRRRVIAGRGGAGGGGDGGSAAVSGVPNVRWSEVRLCRHHEGGARENDPVFLALRTRLRTSDVQRPRDFSWCSGVVFPCTFDCFVLPHLFFPSACGPLMPRYVQKLSSVQRSEMLSYPPCCRLAPPSPRDRSVDSNARKTQCRRWWCGRQGFRRRFLAWGYHPRQESSSSAPRVRTTLSAHRGKGCAETKRGRLIRTTKLKKASIWP